MSLLWLRFKPWPGNFCMLLAQLKNNNNNNTRNGDNQSIIILSQNSVTMLDGELRSMQM